MVFADEFVMFIYIGFFGVLCQPVHPGFSLRRFYSFYVFERSLCFSVQNHLRVRLNKLQIIFSPVLMAPGVSQLVLACLAAKDFRA